MDDAAPASTKATRARAAGGGIRSRDSADDDRVTRLKKDVVLGLAAGQDGLVGDLENLLTRRRLAVDDDAVATPEWREASDQRDPLQEPDRRSQQDRPRLQDFPEEIGFQTVHLANDHRDRGAVHVLLEPPLDFETELLWGLAGGLDVLEQREGDPPV